MPLYVVQMYYATLKKGNQRVSATMNIVAALSGGDFVLISCGEHSSAIAFACNKTETHLAARFRRLRNRDFSLMTFDAAWILGGKMSKRLDDWLDRHETNLRARTAIASKDPHPPWSLRILR